MQVTFYPSKKQGGKIVAFADVVVVDGITVRGFRIVDSDNGLFAAVPSKSFIVDGKTRFYPQVSFADSEVKQRFLSELVTEYDRWLEVQAGTAPRENGRFPLDPEG